MEDKNIPVGALKRDPKFCDNRFNEGDELDDLAKDAAVLDAVNAFSGSTATSYDTLKNLFNTISRAIHEEFMEDEHELIVFMDTHSKELKNHPNDYFRCRPDLIALLKSVHDALVATTSAASWHHILSLVEEKTAADRKNGTAQCATYLGLANQARPNMVAMFGVSASPKSYWIQYSSPAGLETSLEFDWTNLKPLLSYMYTLYCPRTDQPYYDNTITLSPHLSITDAPTWDVEAGGEIYHNCTVKMVGYPWRRMTWTAMTEGSEPFVIKDLYRDQDMNFAEGDLYDVLHELGPAPGFPDIVTWSDVMTYQEDVEEDASAEEIPITITSGACTRIKTRLVMATSGDPLAHCESLVDFLKIMYDVLETHRWAVSEHGILHRDISIVNILINPRSARKPKPYKGKWPKYITQVLKGARKKAASLALLIDLDNATKYPKSPEFMEKLTQLRARTGTPKYIARSVSAGKILIDNLSFEQMPELTGEAKTVYQKAHRAKADPLRHFTDNETTTHGGSFRAKNRHAYADSQRQIDDFSHHPRHDAESVFWCMVAFLLQTLPLCDPTDPEEEEDVNNAAFNEKWRCFAYHEIPTYTTDDSRTGVFGDRQALATYLHERLSRAAPLLSELAQQVQPEYALLTPPPNTFHLHEAMQRIIFKYIHQWESEGFDVKFNTQRTRDTNPIEINILPAVSSHTLNGHNPKRGAGTLEKLEMSESKRLRATAS